MASEFRTAPLGELLDTLIDHRGLTPKKLGGDFSSRGVRVISAKNVKGGRLDLSDIRYVDHEMAKRWMPTSLARGDVILTSEAPLGEVAYVRRNADLVLGQRLFGLRGRANVLHSRYLYYFLRSQTARSRLNARASGTTAQGIRQAELVKVAIDYPPFDEQHRIANILGTLDDKIELNRRMNRTLEKMAAALFKSWFIDFDPVHAKAEHRDPNLPAAIADLFPDTFQPSALGPIPTGWTVTPLSDVIAINPKRVLAKGSLAPFLEMSNMPVQGPSPTAWRMREMTSGTKFINGDTLLARITPCLENGKTAFVDFLAKGEVGWGSTEYIVLRPQGEIPSIFAYLLARTSRFRRFAIGRMTGSSGRQRIPPRSLEKFQLTLPPLDSPIYRAFSGIVDPLFARMHVAATQNRALAGLRDALLPKLLSGELDLLEVASTAEEASA